MNVLVTGGAGFIGSHFVSYLLETDPECRVVNVDKLTYAAHPDTCLNLERLAPGRYNFVKEDIGSPDIEGLLHRFSIDGIVNFAAESHVDRSILDPSIFVQTNIVGVQNLLFLARKNGNIRFIQVSTDEVYGSLSPTESAFEEITPLSPNSPYAASKASADLLALACHRTYNQEVLITRCSNNFGPFQFPEKLIPLVIANAIDDISIPVYGDGKQVRDWIYVRDHCRAISLVLKNGKAGEIYNISAGEERNNIDLIHRLLQILKKPESLISHVGDRPAHDRRYALNSNKIRRELKWIPETHFDRGLELTVQWYLSHQAWWRKVRDAKYYDYYKANYQPKTNSSEGRRS